MAEGAEHRDDGDLARRARGGCRDAFRELVVRHQRGVLNLLCRRLPNRADVEEVAQETFLRAWRNLAGYRDRWRFATWLYAIAIRAAVDRLRALRRRPPTGDDACGELAAGASADPAGAAENGDHARHLWRLVDRLLPPDQRAALWLRYAEGLDIAEIATALGRSGVAVRLLLMRGRRSLSAHLPVDRPAFRRLPEAPNPTYHDQALHDPVATPPCGADRHD